MALADPPSAQSRADFVRGVEFHRAILSDLLDQIEVIENTEVDAQEDDELLAVAGLGQGDPL